MAQGNPQIDNAIEARAQQLFAQMKQAEKAKHKERQAEGIAVAKAKGVKFGRRPIERPQIFGTVKERWSKGEISSREAGQALGVSHVTFLNWAGE